MNIRFIETPQAFEVVEERDEIHVYGYGSTGEEAVNDLTTRIKYFEEKGLICPRG